MTNVRCLVLTLVDQADFSPALFTARLKEAGFKFDNDTCPVKIRKPWLRLDANDGMAVYIQWDLS
jgi:hypothetical protein